MNKITLFIIIFVIIAIIILIVVLATKKKETPLVQSTSGSFSQQGPSVAASAITGIVSGLFSGKDKTTTATTTTKSSASPEPLVYAPPAAGQEKGLNYW